MRGALRRGAGRARARSGRVSLRSLGRQARRRLGGAARPAARPLPAVRDRAGRCRAATCRCSSSTASSPRASSASSTTWRENGYVTLSADEYFQFLHGRAPRARAGGGADLRRRPRQPVERRARRCCERYGMTRHRLPGARPDAPSRPGPPLPDLGRRPRGPRRRGRGRRPGTTGAPALLGGDRVARPLAASSTSRATRYTHARIHTGPEVVGFVTPALAPRLRRVRPAAVAGPDGRDLPGRRGAARARRSSPRAARTSEALRFREDRRSSGAPRARRWPPAAARRSSRGPAGSSELRALVGGAARRAASRPPRSASRAIRRELVRVAPRHRGAHGPPRHPPLLSRGTSRAPTARRLAREAGYRTAFCGKVPGTPITLAGGDPTAIARIGEDYLELLPGRGQASPGLHPAAQVAAAARGLVVPSLAE